jgi:nucleoid DNA-binding protein
MTVTRSDLRKALQDEGFTYRESRLIINTIINAITEKLKMGEIVDTSFGKMTPVSPKPKRAYQLGKIVNTHTKPKVHFRRKD